MSQVFDLLTSLQPRRLIFGLCASEATSRKTPPPQRRWTTQDSNRALFTVLSINTPNKPALPPELILEILSHPSRWLLTAYVQLPAMVCISSEEAERDVVCTPPISARRLPLVQRLVLTFRSKDQGWSSYPADYGSYRNSWTWFEAGLRKHVGGEESVVSTDRERPRQRLQCNRHAGTEAEDYRFVFERDHPLLKCMRVGDEVVLWAMAKFGGWRNFVQEAAIQVWSLDDLGDV